MRKVEKQKIDPTTLRKLALSHYNWSNCLTAEIKHSTSKRIQQKRKKEKGKT